MSLRLRPSWSEIVATLRAEGFLIPEASTSDATASQPVVRHSPWFVRVLIGFGAWIAALLLVAALAATIGLAGGLIPLALIGLGAGIYLLHLDAGTFLSQLGLSVSLAGQLALALGLRMIVDSDLGFAAVMAVLAFALVRAVPDPIHRFLATLCGATAACFFVVLTKWTLALDFCVLALALATAWFWWDQPRRLRRHLVDAWSPVGYGVAVMLFATLLFGLLDHDAGFAGLSTHTTLSRITSVGLGLGTVALALRIGAEARAARPSPIHAIALAALALLGFATPTVPGVAAAIGVLLLAFHRRNPLLLGLAAIFLITFLTLLYYNLSTTLLIKSLHLMAAGALLSAGAWWLHREQAR